MCLRVFLTALGAALPALAQCNVPTFTIHSAADLPTLAQCQTFKGTVEIGISTGASTILSGIESIGGDLIVRDNGQLVSLTSPTLKSIGGAFILANASLLSRITFPSLERIGSIVWSDLGALGAFNFTENRGTDTTGNISVSNTLLSSLDGINAVSATTISITDNPRLTNFTSSVGNTSSLEIRANGDRMSISFPFLTYVDGAVMVQGSIESVELPKLSDVQGNFNISSTVDVASSCHALQRLAPTCAGGLDQVHGTFACLSNGDTITSSQCSVTNATVDGATQAPDIALGSGTKIGAGVGAASGVLLLLGTGFCLRLRRKMGPPKTPANQPEEGYVKPEADQESANLTVFNQPLQLKRKSTNETHCSDDDPGANELFALHDFLKIDPVTKNGQKTADE